MKVSYRKYSADNAVKIVRNQQHPTGLECRSVSVVTYPLENDEHLYILKTMPSGLPIPQRFIENSRVEIEKILRSIYRYFDGYIDTALRLGESGRQKCVHPQILQMSMSQRIRLCITTL